MIWCYFRPTLSFKPHILISTGIQWPQANYYMPFYKLARYICNVNTARTYQNLGRRVLCVSWNLGLSLILIRKYLSQRHLYLR
jgi:hypothetical protein